MRGLVICSRVRRLAGWTPRPPVMWVATGLGLLLVLAACQVAPAAGPTPVREPRPGAPVATLQTVLPSFTPTSQPSATPLPPTPTGTLTPTLTFTPTATFPPAEPPTRGPYLQSVEPDSVWVVWDTARRSLGYVEYGDTPALGLTVREARAVTHHALQLNGLKPYTQVYYRVSGDRASASFRSAAGPGQESFRFAVVGDTRSNPAAHAAINARILQAKPDFALHLGDLVEDGLQPKMWDEFFKIEAPLLRAAPLFPMLGNHEAQSDLYFQAFLLPGNERWYGFDYGNARFIVLEADSYLAAPFKPGGEQRNFLEEQLAQAGNRRKFVFMHVPVHTSLWEDGGEVNLRLLLAPLFEKYAVTAVFAGHMHNYERILVKGITYVVTGGGGAPLYGVTDPEPGRQRLAVDYHFMQVDIQAGVVKAQAIGRDGKVIDAFELK